MPCPNRQQRRALRHRPLLRYGKRRVIPHLVGDILSTHPYPLVEFNRVFITRRASLFAMPWLLHKPSIRKAGLFQNRFPAPVGAFLILRPVFHLCPFYPLHNPFQPTLNRTNPTGIVRSWHFPFIRRFFRRNESLDT